MRNLRWRHLFLSSLNNSKQMPCYLTELVLIAEPQTGFRIAFNMFDTDGNERVDKNEFLVVRLRRKGLK